MSSHVQLGYTHYSYKELLGKTSNQYLKKHKKGIISTSLYWRHSALQVPFWMRTTNFHNQQYNIALQKEGKGQSLKSFLEWPTWTVQWQGFVILKYHLSDPTSGRKKKKIFECAILMEWWWSCVLSNLENVFFSSLT